MEEIRESVFVKAFYLFSKKELYQFKMDDSIDIRDYLNYFTKLITQLFSIGVKVDDEDKMLLMSSLSNYYESLIITLQVGKERLEVDDVIVMLLENEKLKGQMINTKGVFLLQGLISVEVGLMVVILAKIIQD